MLKETNIEAGASKQAIVITLILCFIFAIIEGFDLQSMGVAAPRMKAEMLLNSTEMGWVFSAAVLGTLPGAVIAGRIADSIGRKKVFITSIAIFGLMSLLTPFTKDLNSLLLVRFLTGLGMGGALPIVITMVSEAVPEKYKATAVSAMYCGMPIGGVLTSVVALSLTADHEWRHIFYIGGIAPLILVPILIFFLPESKAYLNKIPQVTTQKPSVLNVLFAKPRVVVTSSLWLSFFGTLLVLALFQNWLPTLISGLGLDKQQASYIQIGFNLGGSIGVLILGLMLDRLNKFFIVASVYAGILVSLIGLAYSNSASSFIFFATCCGMFVIGCQSILYTLAAKYYPTEMRGTGVGAAVAVGRLGAFAGPLVAGYLLGTGQSEIVVIASSIPMILLAAISALILLRKPEHSITRKEPLGTVTSSL
ncbi:3-(3-hydroxy-phenyl)propionate transporter MhpT [Acinetobacter higginsii]|uniref:3-(3-hydroxy-phenyl)propionate transporter MhpT n=1 Tax=Acinetobacter higginsii TaxID=70347 RepID=UPI001F4A730D|nr:3-(3-hydroxy-phenyl)propionate transporter MhpT [Acinetobacter higginsii]MCH7293985.1 3-(3-hydroxy-phenyl)propionate transporter MhpT [Acinetobacter higginsii]